MADSDVTKTDDSAEKAYAAAAAEVIAAKELPEAETDLAADPVEFPAKPKRGRKPAVSPAESVAPEPMLEPVAAVPAAKPAAKPRAAKPIKAAVKRAAAKPVAAAPAKSSPIKARKASAQKIKTAPKAAPKAPPKTVPKVPPKTVKASPAAAPTIPFFTKLKEIPMDMTTSIKDAVSGAQEKAKDAFTKTSAAASEATEFAKGNVEAFVESGKILASGLQELGNKFVADSKSAFETATTDVKALTAIKSPTEFFQFQTDLLRRNFDSAVSYTTKTGEAMLKLSGDVIKPISGRVSLAVDKVKAAA